MSCPATVESAIAALNAVTASSPAEALIPWDETFAGDVEFRLSSGWTVVVFNDCMSWDYIDHVIAPDQTRFEFDTMPDELRFWMPGSEEQRGGWPGAFAKN